MPDPFEQVFEIPGAEPIDAMVEAAERARIGPTANRDYIRTRIATDLRPELQTCVDEARRSDPGFSGTVQLQFAIEAANEEVSAVTAVQIARENTSLQGASFLECVRDSTAGLLFDPMPEGDRVYVDIPLQIT